LMKLREAVAAPAPKPKPIPVQPLPAPAGKSPLAVVGGFIIAILAAGYALLKSNGLVP
jgi:hypothetical protein